MLLYLLCQLASCLRYLHSFPTRRSSDLAASSLFREVRGFLRLALGTEADQVAQQAVQPRLRGFHRLDNGRRLLAHGTPIRSEEHTSELQSHSEIVCRLLLEKKTTT